MSRFRRAITSRPPSCEEDPRVGRACRKQSGVSARNKHGSYSRPFWRCVRNHRMGVSLFAGGSHRTVIIVVVSRDVPPPICIVYLLYGLALAGLRSGMVIDLLDISCSDTYMKCVCACMSSCVFVHILSMTVYYYILHFCSN